MYILYNIMYNNSYIYMYMYMYVNDIVLVWTHNYVYIHWLLHCSHLHLLIICNFLQKQGSHFIGESLKGLLAELQVFKHPICVILNGENSDIFACIYNLWEIWLYSDGVLEAHFYLAEDKNVLTLQMNTVQFKTETEWETK